MPERALPEPLPPRALWAARAWTGREWKQDVLLHVGADGHWASVEPGARPERGAVVLDGPVLPGLVDAHSHAFQRAFAGLAERRDLDQDDFWSWRDGMYRVALGITPEQQQAVAAQLFLELVQGGFTHVCEFHYLHNDCDGQPFAPDPARMARAIAAAAREVGIGLTLLPAVYERAGFAHAALRDDQRRFRADSQTVLALREALAREQDSDALPVRVGLALHSLRAATPQSIETLRQSCGEGPIHIHVAEQTREIDECLAATGLRPVEWLCRHATPDRRWQLVHATHVTPAEIEAVARSGAGVVLCPGTEANLGDGIADLPAWLRHGVPISIGTDSHVSRAAMEELRLLEYSQRFKRLVRCVAAHPQLGEPSTAAALWDRVLAGGAMAAGFDRWGLQAGARADLLVIDTRAAALLGVPDDQLLDALMFSSPLRPFRDVLIAGHWVCRAHRSEVAPAVGARFVEAMGEIWRAPAPPG